jgi:hypothetical protein
MAEISNPNNISWYTVDSTMSWDRKFSAEMAPIMKGTVQVDRLPGKKVLS